MPEREAPTIYSFMAVSLSPSFARPRASKRNHIRSDPQKRDRGKEEANGSDQEVYIGHIIIKSNFDR